MNEFKFSDVTRRQNERTSILSEQEKMAAAFKATVDPHNIVDLRDVEDLDGLSQKGKDYLLAVQERILQELKHPAGKGLADLYLDQQATKWNPINSNDAVRIRAELMDYRMAVTYAMEA